MIRARGTCVQGRSAEALKIHDTAVLSLTAE